jgi:hypothetical protein
MQLSLTGNINMKNVDLSNDIAAGMDAALRDEDNKNMFSSSAMLEKLAFTRVADEDKQTEVEAELVKVASADVVELPKGFTVLASVATLVQLSEDLDNNGFDRLAAVSLLLAEKLIVEAKAKKSAPKSKSKSKSKSKPKSKVDMKDRMKKMREMKGGKKKDPSKDKKDSKKEDKSKSKSK